MGVVIKMTMAIVTAVLVSLLTVGLAHDETCTTSKSDRMKQLCYLYTWTYCILTVHV